MTGRGSRRATRRKPGPFCAPRASISQAACPPAPLWVCSPEARSYPMRGHPPPPASTAPTTATAAASTTPCTAIITATATIAIAGPDHSPPLPRVRPRSAPPSPAPTRLLAPPPPWMSACGASRRAPISPHLPARRPRPPCSLPRSPRRPPRRPIVTSPRSRPSRRRRSTPPRCPHRPGRHLPFLGRQHTTDPKARAVRSPTQGSRLLSPGARHRGVQGRAHRRGRCRPRPARRAAAGAPHLRRRQPRVGAGRRRRLARTVWSLILLTSLQQYYRSP